MAAGQLPYRRFQQRHLLGADYDLGIGATGWDACLIWVFGDLSMIP